MRKHYFVLGFFLQYKYKIEKQGLGKRIYHISCQSLVFLICLKGSPGSSQLTGQSQSITSEIIIPVAYYDV